MHSQRVYKTASEFKLMNCCQHVRESTKKTLAKQLASVLGVAPNTDWDTIMLEIGRLINGRDNLSVPRATPEEIAEELRKCPSILFISIEGYECEFYQGA